MDILNEHILNEFLFGIWTESDLKDKKWKFDRHYVNKEYNPEKFNISGFKVIQDPRFADDEHRMFTAYYTIYDNKKYRLLFTPFVDTYMRYTYKILSWEVESGKEYYDREYPTMEGGKKAMKQYVGMFLRMIKIPPKYPFDPYDKKK